MLAEAKYNTIGCQCLTIEQELEMSGYSVKHNLLQIVQQTMNQKFDPDKQEALRKRLKKRNKR